MKHWPGGPCQGRRGTSDAKDEINNRYIEDDNVSMEDTTVDAYLGCVGEDTAAYL